MKTFLKAVLLVAAAIIAVKLLPLTLALGFVLGFALVALLGLGVSILGLLAVVAAGLLAVLAPLWIPVLAIIGLVALCKKLGGKPAAANATMA